MEEATLERWESRSTFHRLREQTGGGKTFGFIDGPVTANKTMGACTQPGAARSRT